jgi:hypothetical protein
LAPKGGTSSFGWRTAEYRIRSAIQCSSNFQPFPKLYFNRKKETKMKNNILIAAIALSTALTALPVRAQRRPATIQLSCDQICQELAHQKIIDACAAACKEINQCLREKEINNKRLVPQCSG